MNFPRLIPVYLSALLIAAHCLRHGWLPAVALSVLFPFILLVRRPWAARAVQLILVGASIEWIRTLVTILNVRRTYGEPWLRMALILGGVAIFTGCSALLFFCRSLKTRYKR